MGGSRCIFRDCCVGTSSNPGMHFFTFPVRDRPRFLKWVKMAAAEYILSMPVSQQKNRVICARHFRDDHFMNYKKDRLAVTKAVPTLMRLGNGMALDYEKLDEDGNPELITLEPPTMPHLIPPPDFKCPLNLDNIRNINILKYTNPKLQDKSNNEHQNEISESASVRNEKTINISSDVNPTKKPKILNSCSLLSKNCKDTVNNDNSEEEIFMLEEVVVSDDCGDVELYEINDEHEDDANIQVMSMGIIQADNTSNKSLQSHSSTTQQTQTEYKIISQQEHDDICAPLKIQHEIQMRRHAAATSTMTKRIEQLTEALKLANIELNSKQEKLNHLDKENRELKTENEILTNKINQFSVEQSELKSQNMYLQSLCSKLEEQQQHVVSTSKDPSSYVVPSLSAVATPAYVVQVNKGAALSATTLTKAQLFNGVKKYLSSSMVALVRMEMFGNSERQWKPDERRAALDLLRLGEPIYQYFSDEWRFRLPPLRQVVTWLQEDINIDDDDDL